jgi:FeS assembly SUF system regulator
MIRLTKQADYAIVLLIRMVEDAVRPSHSAHDLADEVHLPGPIVSKILKVLAREGLLTSQRGVNGGYSLAKPAGSITVAEIIRAVEGPIALTECQTSVTRNCMLHPTCSSRAKWNRINSLVEQTLDGISLDEMARPLSDAEQLVSIHLTSEAPCAAPAAP